MTKAIMVGKPDANASVMMAPEADHVKISICPGVSTMMYFRGGSRGFSHRLITCTHTVAMVQFPEVMHLQMYTDCVACACGVSNVTGAYRRKMCMCAGVVPVDCN